MRALRCGLVVFLGLACAGAGRAAADPEVSGARPPRPDRGVDVVVWAGTVGLGVAEPGRGAGEEDGAAGGDAADGGPVPPPVVLELEGPGGPLRMEDGRREVRLRGARLFLGQPVFAPRGPGEGWTVSGRDLETTLEPLLAMDPGPAARPVRRVFLDPGHGGENAGARSVLDETREADLVLDLARRLRELLVADGFEVVLSREADVFVGLGERARAAAAAGADVFVSLHLNAAPGRPDVEGAEVYALTPRFDASTGDAAPDGLALAAHPGNGYEAASVVLAWTLQERLRAAGGVAAVDRGVKRARFAVLRELAACPGVLVEAGFLTSPAEAARLADPAHREAVAEALRGGLRAYAGAVGRRAVVGSREGG